MNATAWLTFYSWHRKRGQAAMNEVGVLPNYTGRAIHDRLSSYDHYGCEHSLCGPICCVMVSQWPSRANSHGLSHVRVTSTYVPGRGTVARAGSHSPTLGRARCIRAPVF
nr:hypothetical protein [Ktedonobacter racemifer]